MRIAIYSDIHANLEAYKAVLNDIAREGIDTCVNLGDLVGYGPKPVEVVAIARKNKHHTIKGNHDQAVLDEIDARNGTLPLDQRLSVKACFNLYALRSGTWSAGKLAPAKKLISYLRELPLVMDQREGTFPKCTTDHPYALRFVHAAPKGYERVPQSEHPDDFTYATEWDYIQSNAGACANLIHLLPGTLCFTGHTHLPCILSTQDYVAIDDYDCVRPSRMPRVLVPDRDQRVIVNVGSVGQPRDAVIDPDGDYFHWKTKACYCIYDAQTMLVESDRSRMTSKKQENSSTTARCTARTS